jgi:hypothetical protein
MFKNYFFRLVFNNFNRLLIFQPLNSLRSRHDRMDIPVVLDGGKKH